MPKIRVLTVTDLHLREALYERLAAAVSEHKPDVVACVGDFLDEGEDTRSRPRKLSVQAAALALSELPCEVVFTRGNHEGGAWPLFEKEWRKTGKPLHALHGDYFAFGPLIMVGFPCWLGDDTFYSEGRPLARYHPDDWLPNLLALTGEAGKAFWLLHEPPTMDLAAMEAYEPEWRDAILQYQPLVTVSGHDHTTPLRSGRWHTKLGKTVCVNAGQRIWPKVGPLIYCLFDFTFPSAEPSLPSRFRFHRFQ